MKEKTIILKGITRNPYAFTIYPWGAPLYSAIAVYAVLKRIQHGYSILYIGSSSELEPHLAHHDRLAEFDREGKTHVGVHIEPVMSRRHAKVTDLVAGYAPMLNGLRRFCRSD